MAENKEQTEMFDMADKFIAAANQLLAENEEALGKISVAFRYAAARFSAHEAARGSGDLETDKDKALEWYANQFQEMLSQNLDQYIEFARNQKQ